MLQRLQETTPDGDYPNHVYFVDSAKGKCYAYIPAGTNTKVWFAKPLSFYKSRRTFKVLKEKEPR